MSTDIQASITILRASVVEGRAENVRYRQDQLHSLHAALRKAADVTCQAIAEDSATETAEAEMEFYLAVDALKQAYESLDFEKCLENEYLVANGKDNVERRVALGFVAIRPSRHSRFYSVLTPLVAALSAGNCVLLELDGSSPSVDAVLQSLLAAALDKDTFRICSSRLENQTLSQIDVLVDQTSPSGPSSAKVLISSPHSRVVAIVDRTSNLNLAAKSITKSRLSTNSSAPYSPDLVIVNEYVVESFAALCLEFAGSLSSTSKVRTSSSGERKVQALLGDAERSKKAKIHRSKGTSLIVVEILDRSSPLAQTKLEGECIVLLPSSGLVDAVGIQQDSPPLLASYLFASPAACKFLSEQISSLATYINHIPPQLLIGPASPVNHKHNLHPRYKPEIFSTPRPQFVTPPKPLPASTKLKEIALKELPPTGQRPGHAVGFFEQGILIGLGTTSVIVLPLLGWALFAAGKQSWRFIGARIK